MIRSRWSTNRSAKRSVDSRSARKVSMTARLFREVISLTATFGAACSSGLCETSFRVSDPGVRPVATDAGTAVSGVDADAFARARYAFREVHSIAGDLESGAGLGPLFNGTSCGGCHAYPASGGSSPKRNPQLEMAIAHGARNSIPDFLKADGPVLAVRWKTVRWPTSGSGSRSVARRPAGG